MKTVATSMAFRSSSARFIFVLFVHGENPCSIAILALFDVVPNHSESGIAGIAVCLGLFQHLSDRCRKEHPRPGGAGPDLHRRPLFALCGRP